MEEIGLAVELHHVRAEGRNFLKLQESQPVAATNVLLQRQSDHDE